MRPFDSISVQWLSEYSKPLQQFSDSIRRPLKLMSEPKRTLKQTIDAVQAHQDFLDSQKYAQPVQTNIPSASAKRK